MYFSPHCELDETLYVKYYQGEATFSFSRLHFVSGIIRKDQKKEWLDVAKAAARYIIDDSWDVPDEKFVDDHWLMYDLAELHHCDRPLEDKYVDFAMRTVRLLAKRQYKEGERAKRISMYLIWLERSINQHFRLQQRPSQKAYVWYKQMKRKLQDSVRYQLKQQYYSELAMYMRDPARIVG